MSATRPVLLIDVRNVVGSRPDGWWRDPEGACVGLVEAVAVAPWVDDRRVVAVVDGPPSDRLPEGAMGPVEVVRAGPGRDAADDRIVELLQSGEVDSVARTTVVTADRELRDRVREARSDATCVGPTWLRDRIDW